MLAGIAPLTIMSLALGTYKYVRKAYESSSESAHDGHRIGGRDTSSTNVVHKRMKNDDGGGPTRQLIIQHFLENGDNFYFVDIQDRLLTTLSALTNEPTIVFCNGQIGDGQAAPSAVLFDGELPISVARGSTTSLTFTFHSGGSYTFTIEYSLIHWDRDRMSNAHAVIITVPHEF